jgi:dTDP-glucose 4,6-dehydratase
MKNVLVAGGAGFVGSHLCDLLIKNANVVCVDNMITGALENIKHLENNKQFKFINMDICSTELPKALSGYKFDMIYNMASPASPIDYIEYPIETLLTGSIGVKNLLDIAIKDGSRILIASTSEVYGDPLEHPQKEEYWGNVNPIGLRSCYDEAKRFMEALTMAYKRKKNADIRICRIFNTYGPRMRLADGRVVPNFISQAIKGEDITVYGDGSQTRSFCYVSDLVDGIVKLMGSDVDTPVNLGNPNERSIIGFAKDIVDMLGSKSKIEHLPPFPDDPRKRRPDITKAKKLLNWEPKVDFTVGIKATIEYFKPRI